MSSPEFRFIAYDLRGRRDSDKPEQGYYLAVSARGIFSTCSTTSACSACSARY